MKYLSALLPLISALTCNAADDVLCVDFRERTPEMRVVDGLPSGPLVSVLETAAQRVGVELHWRQAPFLRSLDDLRTGRIDLVPRVLMTEARRAYIHYLPSIGNQPLHVRFVVRPGQEARLSRYEDLYRLALGASVVRPISNLSTAMTCSIAPMSATMRNWLRCSGLGAWIPSR